MVIWRNGLINPKISHMTPLFDPQTWMDNLKKDLSRVEIEQHLDSITEAMLSDPVFTNAQPSSGQEFDKLIADYVSHIYLKLGHSITVYESHKKGQDLLNRQYQPGNPNGYDLAMVDVVQEGNLPMEQVLRVITDGIKQELSASTQSQIIHRRIRALTWSEKCQVGEWIRQDFKKLDIQSRASEEGATIMLAYLESWTSAYLETSYP